MTIQIGAAGLPTETDVLVIGLGITGAGVCLDAASRGLNVVGVEAADLAHGTSRWSSKLVHGGLRYLAQAQFDVAAESAIERGILMTTTAPHLTRALPMLLPLTADVSRNAGRLVRIGVGAGDLLRRVARTPRSVLPTPRTISATETVAHAPVVRRKGLRGGVLSFDGQLVDDARLVIAVARTAAREGAELRTRTRVLQVDGHTVTVRDEVTGAVHSITAKAVINATGVWADTLAPGITLQPSRGTHLVLRAEALPGLRVALMAPVPGHSNRFVFALPQPDGRFFVGLTDEPTSEVPDVPEAPEKDIEFLLQVLGQVLEVPLTRADVAGAFAGLRPLLRAEGSSADISRRHAVLTAPDGMVTVVGGKLTTYRRMAEDAVDAAVARHGLVADLCRTRRLPLVGAGPVPAHADPHLVSPFGAEAQTVLDHAQALTGLPVADLLAFPASHVHVCLAELIWGVTHEAAGSVEDLLERRTRVSLSHDEDVVRPLAERALQAALAVSGTP